jgi:hypothetical protein
MTSLMIRPELNSRADSRSMSSDDESENIEFYE